MKVAEIFASIQGEGRHIGKPTAFIRLTGCNLDCTWCDTKYARTGGKQLTVAEIVKAVRKLGLKSVCVTGGEPMLQLRELRQLLKHLRSAGCETVLETNGTIYDKEAFQAAGCVSADMKPPSSGEKSDERILSKLSEKDQVKVVVADDRDLAYAKRIVKKSKAELIIQPVDGKEMRKLAQDVLKLKLDARVLPPAAQDIGVKMKDTQDRSPKVRQSLERVGITNLRTMIQTIWKGKNYHFTPTIEIAIDLDKDRKGVHMSRLIEAIAEAVEEETQKPAGSIEEIEKRILDGLKKRHPFRRGEIRMETDMMLQKKTPVSGKKTQESHRIEATVIKDGSRYSKKLKVTVLGNTVCPHSMVTAGKPHIQRAVGELEIVTGYANRVELEDMVGCVECSFSSEVYTLLKTEDEKYVVNKMFENPKFVEDVAREILENAKKKFKAAKIRSKATSHESIHRHDVIAEGSA
ncbi:MAG: GTP cyclohydrolase, FolE2/MptA family [Candidatus Altiarchaeota archaeon]